MSGLSETERAECTKILQMLPKGDLMSLNDTVTNKMIAVGSETEAADSIISFTKNAEELLRRKKVNRDVIFKYLANEGVVMLPSSEKNQLVKKTLEFWSSGKVVVYEGLPGQKDKTIRKPKETASVSTNAKDVAGIDPLALGQQFCQWFFQLLNSQNPSLGQQPQDWGVQHFWPDVKLSLLSRAGTTQSEDHLGAELVSGRLLALTRDERLLFSPNLEPDGLRTLASPHGLVLVSIAGTIHRDGAVLGIFEQQFGIIRSPLENNSWKIKFVNLKIRGQDSLSGTDMAAPALSYNSSELKSLCSS